MGYSNQKQRTPDLRGPYTRECGPDHLRECVAYPVGDCKLSGDRRKKEIPLIDQLRNGTIATGILIIAGIPQGRRKGDKQIEGLTEMERKYGDHTQRSDYISWRDLEWKIWRGSYAWYPREKRWVDLSYMGNQWLKVRQPTQKD